MEKNKGIHRLPLGVEFVQIAGSSCLSSSRGLDALQTLR
jgi:hypothetical protein